MAPYPGGGTRRPPHIRDVASLAGVGVGTVSRVLNDSPGVSDATRRRVREAMRELGYRPSPAARRLSLGRTLTVGVVAPFFTSPSVVERLRGIDDVIGRSTYDFMLFNVETLEQRADALSQFARRDRVDGVIVISLPLHDDEVAGLARERLRTVLVDVAHPALATVSIDDVEGGRLAARHLVEAGHRCVAYVGDPADNPFGFRSSEHRLEGFRAALAECGVPLPPERIQRGPYGREGARELTGRLLELPERPSAIFAASDVQAFGVMDAALRAGLDVPGDLSVVGFDDIELAGAIGLTTVRQPLRESGRRGAELLLAALGGPPPEGNGGLPPLAIADRRTVRRVA